MKESVGAFGALACAVLCAFAAGATQVPYATCAHLSRPGEFETRVRELELMKGVGIGWVRTDFDWKNVEPRPGEWTFAHLDRLLGDAERIGVKVLPILDYEVPFADHPWEPNQLPLWRRYVRTLVARYRGRCSVWEVWNEQNCDQGHKHPFPNPEGYARLLRAACEEIRAVDPSLRVAIGGFAGVPLDYIEGVYKAGGRDFFDIMNVHPYQSTARAEGRMEREYEGLRALMTKYGDGAKPIWATEIGLNTIRTEFGGAGFLKAALARIDPTRRWRILHVENDALPVRNVRRHARAVEVLWAAELAGTGVVCEVCTFETVRSRLADGVFDAVVLPFSEEYPADALDDLVCFVARGGTLVEMGGMAFFKPMSKGQDGVWRKTGDSAAGPRRFRFRVASSHSDKTLPRKARCRAVPGFTYSKALPPDERQVFGWGEVRFFFPDGLKPGDVFEPLMTARAQDGRDLASAALIRYGSDLKGNLVLAGYFERGIVPFDEEEQGIGCARQLNLAFALGYEKVFWYEFLRCSDYGIVDRKTFEPRPAFLAYQVFVQARPSGSRQVKDTWKSADGDVYFPRWTRPDGTRAGAVWSVSGRGRLPQLPEFKSILRLTDWLGRELKGLPAVLPDTPIYFQAP